MNRDFLMGYGAGRSAGSGGGGGGVFRINATIEYDQFDQATVTLDKTFAEIKAAYDAGSDLVLIDDASTVYQLSSAGTESFTFGNTSASQDAFNSYHISVSADWTGFSCTDATGANGIGNAWWSPFIICVGVENGAVTWDNFSDFPSSYYSDTWQGQNPVVRLYRETNGDTDGFAILNCEFMDVDGHYRFSHTYKDGQNFYYEAITFDSNGTFGYERTAIQ